MNERQRRNYEWQLQYEPAVFDVLAHHVFARASFRQDTKQATDAVLYCARGSTFALRIRRPHYAADFPNDVTFRCHSNDHRTELAKVLDGYGDMMLYAFAHEDGPPKLNGWTLLDLRAFRMARLPTPSPISNGDGTAFVAFKTHRLPRGVVIAREPPISEWARNEYPMARFGLLGELHAAIRALKGKP